jgi:short-subunit dehydrogenase
MYPTLIFTRLILEKMKKRYQTSGKRSIIMNLSSVALFHPNPYYFCYGASKLFVHVLDESIQPEL